MLADRLFVRFRRYSQVALGIAGRILCLAPGTLDFALYLLNGAFYLCACVAGQVADLTLGASYYWSMVPFTLSLSICSPLNVWLPTLPAGHSIKRNTNDA